MAATPRCGLQIPKRCPEWLHIPSDTAAWHSKRPWVDRPECDYYDWARGVRSADAAHQLAHRSFESLFSLSLREVADRHAQVAEEVRGKICSAFNRNPANSVRPEHVVLGQSISELSNLAAYLLFLSFQKFCIPEEGRYTYQQFFNALYLPAEVARKKATQQVFRVNAGYPFYEYKPEKIEACGGNPYDCYCDFSRMAAGRELPISAWELATREVSHDGFCSCVHHKRMPRIDKEPEGIFRFGDGAHVSNFSEIDLARWDALFGSFGKFLGGEPLAFAIMSDRMLDHLEKSGHGLRKIAGQFAPEAGLGADCTETAHWISLPELEAANAVLGHYLSLPQLPMHYAYSHCATSGSYYEGYARLLRVVSESFAEYKGLGIGYIENACDNPVCWSYRFRVSFSQYQAVDPERARKMLDDANQVYQHLRTREALERKVLWVPKSE